jgi:hypothetical protein
MMPSTSVKTAQEQRRTPGRAFEPGQSGNPRGRPRGARNKATLAVEALLEGEAEALSRKAVELALAGDVTALRLCLDRLMPPRRDRPVTLDLPAISTAADVIGASAALVSAAAAGEVTPSEAAQLARLVEVHVRAIETHELHERIARLEADAANKGP